MRTYTKPASQNVTALRILDAVIDETGHRFRDGFEITETPRHKFLPPTVVAQGARRAGRVSSTIRSGDELVRTYLLAHSVDAIKIRLPSSRYAQSRF
ncbi:hypothetical protein [Mesorhizobium sp. M9A.F.Ca.ET.002.03.1.2]|uniref:hypothetical protein n=1 Tax=Mesorhizobium sp. M9A.F.Ca.ET.002.03.1.2 TaxID=2493668 RepID=UPI001FE05423|nr:hypothetical protein [Mesorhizobium sp. M9A.F.Ca.ET.002.03.1.2]